MIDIRDALYIPGLGFSVTKTKDQSLGSAEADFEALLNEVRAARQAAGAGKDTEEVFSRKELTKEDIKELAAKYDPTNMSQKEYDAFVDDLIEKGVLEKADLSYIEYRGDLVPNGELVCVGHWDLLEDGPMKGGMGGSLVWAGSSAAPTISYRPTDTNVLAWAKEMSLWKPAAGNDGWLQAENKRSDIFSVLADTLDAMRYQR